MKNEEKAAIIMLVETVRAVIDAHEDKIDDLRDQIIEGSLKEEVENVEKIFGGPWTLSA